jgi:hypothetical protein
MTGSPPGPPSTSQKIRQAEREISQFKAEKEATPASKADVGRLEAGLTHLKALLQNAKK